MLGKLEGVHLFLQGLETLDHHHEVAELVDGTHVEVLRKHVVFHAFPDARPLLVGGHHHAFDAGLADASGGVVDDAEQCLFVFGVDDDAEIGQKVLDFFAVVERQSAVYFIRYVLLTQRFFHRTRLGIGAVEDGEALVGQMTRHLVLEDAVGHHGAFLGVAVGVDEADEFARFLVAPHLFLDLVFVVGDDGIRGVDDVLGGAVVLFQPNQLIVGVVVLEVEDVLDVGPTEGVDALCVVAHHADMLTVARQL